MLIGDNMIKLTNEEIAKVNMPIMFYGLARGVFHKNPPPNYINGTIINFPLYKVLREALISHTLIWIRTILSTIQTIPIDQFFQALNLTFVPYLEYFLEKINGVGYLKIREIEIEIKDETNFSIRLATTISPPLCKEKQEKIIKTFYLNDIFNATDISNKECLTMALDL